MNNKPKSTLAGLLRDLTDIRESEGAVKYLQFHPIDDTSLTMIQNVKAALAFQDKLSEDGMQVVVVMTDLLWTMAHAKGVNDIEAEMERNMVNQILLESMNAKPRSRIKRFINRLLKKG